MGSWLVAVGTAVQAPSLKEGVKDLHEHSGCALGEIFVDLRANALFGQLERQPHVLGEFRYQISTQLFVAEIKQRTDDLANGRMVGLASLFN